MSGARRTVLHYVGYDDDAGGIVSVVRGLAAAGRFDCVLGLNPGGRQFRQPPLPSSAFPRVVGEQISLRNFWRTRRVAQAARAWLREDGSRIFHGHSRAGLLAAWWLRRLGERRVIASVHCYGRHRWLYRRAAQSLGDRLFWLTPEMRSYYGAAGRDWEQCLPGGVTPDYFKLEPPSPAPERLRLGGAGELSAWKRWELVPAAMARLEPGLQQQITFEHIGAPAPTADSRRYAVKVRRLAGQAGPGVRVSWREPEPSSHRLLSVVDMLVVPSHREPYSMILQEALAAGVPVLAADSGGPRDVIQPGVNGWLFADGSAESLAEALRARLQSRDWASLDRGAIRATARRAETAADEWGAVYDRL